MLNDKKDSGFIDDASSLIQNATSAEYHCQMSWATTKDDIYIEIADMLRRDRSKLMYNLISESKAQNYCIIKHTLTVSQNYKELANRYTEMGLIEQARECLEASGRYEALFRLLRERKENKSIFRKIKDKIEGGAENDVRKTTERTEGTEG